MPKTKKKKQKISTTTKAWMIILLLPVTVTIYTVGIISWQQIQELSIVKELKASANGLQHLNYETELPEDYIPIYKSAANEYNIPWTLLAAHHRIETRFSTMETLISPVGAEGHMQFMPCTFVGWSHPTCNGVGKGDIPEEQKTDPAIIEQYGGYGVDANGDGIADPFDLEDAIYSAAKYLSNSGASTGEYEQAIFMYNRSDQYVKEVMYYFNLYEEYRQKEEDESPLK